MKRALLLAMVSVLLIPMAFAQRSTGAVAVNVTIQCNVGGADVSIDGKAVGKTPLTVALAAGDHTISVQAAGYQPFDGKFNITQATTIPVNLLPATVSVTFSANVVGADISVAGSGTNLAGKSPFTAQLLPGMYSIIAQAAGFKPLSTQANVSKDLRQTFALTLESARVDVSLSCNVAGADVMIAVPGSASVAGKTPFVTQLLPGQYTVTMSASGYKSNSQQVTVAQAPARQSFTLSLEQIKINVTLSCNVAGADVAVAVPGAAAIMGKAPLVAQLLPGQYMVTMSAAGYKSNSQQVAVVQAPAGQSFALSLEQIKIDVSLTCNVAGADVTVAVPGAASIMGKAPLATQLVPGQYTVTMSAANYKTASTQVVVALTPQKQATNITLEPSNATVNIVIPRSILDPDSKDEGLLRGMVKIFIDGKLMNAKNDVVGNLQLAPGKHIVRVASGSLSFQQEFDFAAGAVYNLELAIGMTLKPATTK